MVLRNNANLSTGGTATDVTDDVHPQVAARAVSAAQMVGLEICGVDVVCETVAARAAARRRGRGQRRAGLRMHLAPSFGKPRRDVARPSSSASTRPGEDGRIPVVAVTGTNGKTTVTRLIAHLFSAAGPEGRHDQHRRRVVDGRQIDSGDCSGPKSARNVLAHPDTEAAVFETARGGILREGPGLRPLPGRRGHQHRRGDHLGLNYITTVEDLAVLKRVIVQNVAPTGFAVLNAADPITLAMASGLPGGVILFAVDGHLPALVAHRAQGGRSVFVEGATSWRRGRSGARAPCRCARCR